MIFSPLGKSWSDIRSGPPMIAPPAQACSSNAETLQRYLAVYRWEDTVHEMHRGKYRNPVGYRDWRYLKPAESCWK